MRKTALVSRRPNTPEDPLDILDLDRYLSGWTIDAEISGYTDATMGTRRTFIRQLRWFFHREGYTAIGERELRALLAYLRTGHKEPGGRWGNPKHRAHSPVDRLFNRR